ncbi:DUF2946 domain-containing protein [Paraburkholderia caribensis]|uniref:DUF2946 domain-containing protein n=1 Tax=Paraburkholderia caribensis TaxID=75105 RepID=A0ABV0DRC8_9BURK|nr:DUF2946 domain-containing protein [Paraburkholderia caribensis]MCO4876621.1 DUF2946 domain-containing protein [Paraburkholderia caribensis]
MTSRARKHRAAWLGLIAMWLIVFVPLVSQLVALAEASEPFAVNCSAIGEESPSHHATNESLSACGYCDLIAQQAFAVPPAPPAEAATVLLATVATLAHPLFITIRDYPSGRPRDPPALS